jgi:hypothetical protein
MPKKTYPREGITAQELIVDQGREMMPQIIPQMVPQMVWKSSGKAL